MLKFLLRFLFILLPVFACLVYSLCQNKEVSIYHQLLLESKQADSIYDAATAEGNSKSYDEKKEAQLNQLALSLYKNVFQKAPSTSQFDSLRFFSAFRTGELEHYFEHFKEALIGYSNAISVKLKSSLPDSLLFKPYLYSGILYYNQNKFDSASLLFKKAEAVQIKYNYTLPESERLYNTFGVLYFQKGDYKQAKNYFLKALEVLPKSHPYYKELFTNYKINLAQIYFKLEDYDEANLIYQSLLNLQGIDKNDINQNIGMINLYLGAPNDALNYFRKVNYGLSSKRIFLYHNIGEAFFNLNAFDSSKKYLQKAVETNFTLGVNTDHIAYGQTLKSLGDWELHFQDFQKALSYYQQAVHQFYPAFSNESINANPDLFSGVFSYINLFNALAAKAEAFHQWYRQSSNLQKANNELATYQSAFKLIDYVERTYNSDEARLFLDRIKYTAHAKPIDIAYQLYIKTKDKKYLEDLYIFDQQNKASVLALRTQSIAESEQQNTSLLSKENALRSEITRLSLKAMQIKDSTETVTINKEIRDDEIELGKIQEQSIVSSASTKIPSIQFLQKELLDNKTALISFHLSEDKLFTLTVTKDSFTCHQQKLPLGFNESIISYITHLKTNTAPDSLRNESKNLYSILFNSSDLKKIERLILIPDDELNFLSFESLQDSNGSYLIQKYAVQYQYSTALLKKESANFSHHETLAFAPYASKEFDDSNFHFEALPNSLNEIKNLKGEKFTDSAATKNKFIAEISKYKVLHLATHAVVNNKQDNLSFISFYPSKKNPSEFLLYSEEIYNLPLNKTELVILSACETASGNLIKGEGVMSLSRAFAYAGCPNIITSLWNANDFSTSYLTNRIHFYLDKNYSIDEALRQSKLDYLNDKSINPRLKNPFYWSHLIFIGNYSPAKTFSYWWVIYIVAGICLVTFLFLKRIRSRIERDLSDS